MSREAMQMALKALENGAIARPGWVPDYDDAIAALRAALVEQDDDLTAAWMAGAAAERKRAEQAQPVAWRDPSNTDPGQGCTYVPAVRDKWPHIFTQPLYTTPPSPQPLSGLDVERLLEDVVGSLPVARKLIRAVEAEVIRRMGVQR